jgi:Adenosine deaminase
VLDTAEGLLALVFGDLELLGSDCLLRDLASEGSLHSLDSSEWTEILSARFPDLVHPALQYDVRNLLTAADGDSLRLLTLAADWCRDGRKTSPGAGRFPVSVLVETGAVTAPHLGFAVADGHLHAGACMTLPLFLQSLGARREAITRPAEGIELALWSPSGRSWDMSVILAATRWALRLMDHLVRGNSIDDADKAQGAGLTAEIVARVRDGTFWSHVRDVALVPGGFESDAVPFNRTMVDLGQCPSVARLFASVSSGSWLETAALNSFLMGFARATAAIASLLTSRPGEGLSRFQERFRLMGAARDSAIYDDKLLKLKSEWVLQALSTIAPTDEVIGAELRRTVAKSDAREFRKEVLGSLQLCHAAFADFAWREGHAIALTMPVGFARHGSARLNSAEAAPVELEHVLGGCEGLRLIATEYGEVVMRGIWSIDVASQELGSANWPFQLGAEILADDSLDLQFTIHAGESFTSQINGIRRVGELFMGEVAPSRIGHALALDEQAAHAILARGHPPIVRAEAIMDLAWLIAEGLDENDRLAVLLNKVAAPQKPSIVITPSDWATAFSGLHRMSEGGEAMAVKLDAGGYDVRPIDERIARAKGGSAVDRATAALGWSAPVAIAGCDMSSELEGDLLAEWMQVTDEFTPKARAHVIDAIRQRGTVIESCPTSNVVLARLGDYGSHPLWGWSENSVDVSISSDDPLLFGSTVLQEFDAMLRTPNGRAAVVAAAEVSVRECSGGDSTRQEGWRRYASVVEAISRRSYEVGRGFG